MNNWLIFAIVISAIILIGYITIKTKKIDSGDINEDAVFHDDHLL